MGRRLSGVLRERAESKGPLPLYSWWEDRKKQGIRVEVVKTLTYQDVSQLAWSVASLLLSAGVASGDRVLLVFEPGLTFIGAFLGCLAADVVAVPVFPPEPRKTKGRGDLEAFVRIQAGCGARVALTSQLYNWAKKTAELAAMPWTWLGDDGLGWPEDLRWIAVSDDARLAEPPRNEEKEPVAFLQYTSGSTSAPKGVMVTHACLDHNLSLIVSELEAGEDTVVVSWLPQFHDMGLIGSYLGTMYCGGRGFYTSPLNFVKRPSTWIEAISAFKGTHMQAPNFAYALAARKFERVEGLDLAAARHFIDGAEPVDADVITNFEATFAPFGLRRGAIFPTYGLAEHTVMASTNGKARVVVDPSALEEKRVVEVAEGRTLCGCGAPPDGVRVAVVDSETSVAVDRGRVGEIWLSSASVAAGYFGKEPSSEDFGATLDGLTYFRTGDEGFLWDGEIVVCGRIKDLVILRGKNHYPQDIERSLERDEGIRAGCVAAFEDRETLVVVAEVRAVEADLAELAARLAADVASDHGLSLARLVLLKPRTIPKTTSGKITRRKTKAALRNGDLDPSILLDYRGGVLAEPVDTPDNAPGDRSEKQPLLAVDCGLLQARLARDLADVSGGLDARAVPAYKPVADLGPDSLELAQFRGVLENKYHLDNLPDDLLFRQDASIAVLANLVSQGPPFDESKYATALGQVADTSSKVSPFQIDRSGQDASKPKKRETDWITENCPCLLICCPRPRRK